MASLLLNGVKRVGLKKGAACLTAPIKGKKPCIVYMGVIVIFTVSVIEG